MKIKLSIIICIVFVVLTSCGSFGEGVLMGLSSMGSYSGYSSGYSSVGYTSTSGNMDYLLNPNYAVQQVLSAEDQEYHTFAKYNKKSDGSNYTKNEWITMKGQAIQNSKSSSSQSSRYNSSGSSSSSTSSSTKRCRKTSATDIAHCEGTGVCQKCNGKGRYYDTSFGSGRWVDPCGICNGTGKCSSCNGKGYRY